MLTFFKKLSFSTQVQMPTSLPPSGAAGGDLSGTYPNPNVVWGNGYIIYDSRYGLLTGNLSQFASTTSAQLASIISDETGSGALVFGTSPTFVTKITSPELDISGTGGNGFINLVAQSSNSSAPAATGLNLFAGSTGNLSWVRKNGTDTYVRTFASTLTADRTYTLPDTSGTVSLLSDVIFPVILSQEGASFNPADSTTYYWDNNGAGTAVSGRGIYLEHDCTLIAASFTYISTASASTEQGTLFVYLNGTTAYNISTTVATGGSSTGGAPLRYTGLSNNYSAGDYIMGGFTTPAWSTNPTNWRLQLVLWFKRR